MKYTILIMLFLACSTPKPLNLELTPTRYPTIMLNGPIDGDTVSFTTYKMCFIKIAGRTFQVERGGKWIREICSDSSYIPPITRMHSVSAVKKDPFYGIENGHPTKAY